MSRPPLLPVARGFQALATAPQWSRLLERGTHREIVSGRRLIEQGVRSRTVYAVRRGRVRVVYTDQDGTETLIAVRGPGDLLGEYAHGDGSEHVASVWALEHGAVAVLNARAFGQYIESAGLGNALQHYMLGKARENTARMWRTANLGTEKRMAQLFLETVEAAPDGDVPTVPLTQDQIASALGVSRSSVAQLLKLWRTKGLVRTQPAPLTLTDLTAVARRASAT
ncbi:Crp/Fnr family transcriptional regulator [Glycomyces buryatensis]|nr:Crp/Fnr family transcriptional regulator [Glycomyces buryatensis]